MLTASFVAASDSDEKAPVAMPGLPPTQDDNARAGHRGIYGGNADRSHLGGFTALDVAGLSPDGWKWMLETLAVKSVIDVGCGKGVSSACMVLDPRRSDALCRG